MYLTKRFGLYLALLGIVLLALPTQAMTVMEADSVGVEYQQGRRFVKYQVEKGETLFSISKKYNLKMEEVIKFNPAAEKGLQVGQVLLIPMEEVKGLGAGEKMHQVKESETLFSISRQYDIKVKDLRKRNNLDNNQIALGQMLVIPVEEKEKKGSDEAAVLTREGDAIYHEVQDGETLYSISRKYAVSVTDIQKWNDLPGNYISLGQKLIVGHHRETVAVVDAPKKDPVKENPKNDPPKNDPPKTDPKETGTTATTTTTTTEQPKEEPVTDVAPSGFEQIIEDGLAEVIDGNSDNRKFLGLHRTAPIGTLMQVVNEMNNQKIFVRIVGRIPDTGDNAKVQIKISKAAYDRLGAVAPRFPVTLSYLP